MPTRNLTTEIGCTESNFDDSDDDDDNDNGNNNNNNDDHRADTNGFAAGWLHAGIRAAPA